MRSKKATMNMITGLLLQVVTVICGFILPRLILQYFGSTYNGITSSISQFLSWIVLLRAGVGGVTRAALYKPLAENDNKKISEILKATEIFMHKISIYFLIFLFLLSCFYPFFIKDNFNWFFLFSLIIVLGISTFVQNYFVITYQILIQADQKQYIYSGIQIVSIILNTILASILIKIGCGIHIVKLGSTMAYILNPFFLYWYVKKNYKLCKNVKPDNTAIKQRWDAFAQQLATLVYNNTSLVVLTFFTKIKEVSVFTVHNLVVSGVWNIVVSCTNGVGAAFGNMMAKKEKDIIDKNFKIYELVNYSINTVLFVSTFVLITPFVTLYTNNVSDANYYRPIFAAILTLASWGNCIRLPYQALVEAAGLFKETKGGAIVEAILNITISVTMVQIIGITGVALGMLTAAIFRTLQYTIYTSKYILKRSYFEVVKRLGGYTAIFIIEAVIFLVIFPMPEVNILNWILYAILVVISSSILILGMNLCFFRKDLMNLFAVIRTIKSR